MKDADPQIRIQAIRASETLYKAGDRSFAADYKALTKDADTDVVMQALMTLNTLKVADAQGRHLRGARKQQGRRACSWSPTRCSSPTGECGPRRRRSWKGSRPFTADGARDARQGTASIYTEVCFACHGDDGRGAKVPGAQNEALLGPPLAASPRVLGHQDYVIKAVLHGLTGPIDGATYPDVMIGMGQNPDEWMAAITSYIRNSFGNRAALVTPGGRQARAGGDGEPQDAVGRRPSSRRRCRSSWSSIRSGS